MRKVIFIDGFLGTEVSKFASELGLSLDGFTKVQLPADFKQAVQTFSNLKETSSDYIFEGSPYGAFISTLFGRKKLITSDQLMIFEKSFSGFYFFVDASDAYVTQLYKTLNKKLTKNDLAKLELHRYLYMKSSMPLKLTYSLHEPNAKAKFIEEFKEAYNNWIIDTTDYKLLQAS